VSIPKTATLTHEQLTEELFGLLRKSAAEADGLEDTLKARDLEIQHLKQANARLSNLPTPKAPELDQTALTKLAHILEAEELLPLGMDAKQACEKISSNPNILIRWMHNLATPLQPTEGRAVKKAATQTEQPISGEGKLVKFAGKTFVDDAGWLAAIE
jgi:hypothetical protein